MEIMEIILAFLMIFCIVTICVAFLSIPIMIANARGICGNEKTIITVLSILGIFFGLTWVIALILSLIWTGDNTDGDNLDKLEKLARLYKDKVITKTEYERMKDKLLRE